MPSSPPRLPLAGVKVVELCHLIAGPYCCQMLADEGATVIKVEPPEGELTRHREPIRHTADGEVTAYFASLNRDKESVALDLKNPQGAAVFAQLLAGADVFVTNMRPAALQRLGFDPQSLHERHPRLIIACISGFGIANSGEHADRAGLAMVAEAMAGATGLTRDHSGNPVWCGFALGDIMAAASAHAGILLALRNQERDGVGRLLDVALVECMLPMVSVALGRVQVPEDTKSSFAGSNNFHGVPYGAFPAADGAVNIGCNRDEFWQRLCVAMGKPTLGTDPRYATYKERIKRQGEVHDITEAFTRAHTRAEIIDKLVQADVPAAAVLSMEEVVADEYLRQRGALLDVDDGFGGSFTLPANAAWPERPGHRARVPRLGEQRDAVLHRELHMTAADVARLERAGAFGSAAPVRGGAIPAK
jgi:crotonobetainyl-CoA:carnitine CoA-transferase CaiB-like acyl-CoA transferase